MNKIAELSRLAEVRGTLAAFIDGGLLNMDVNDTEGFDKLACDVADSFGDSLNYTVEDILCKTAEVLEQGQEKTAAEDVQFALGGLMLSKLAGEMSDEEFGSAVNDLLKEASIFGKKSKMQQVGEAISDKMDDAREAIGDAAESAGKKVKDTAKAAEKKLKEVKKNTAKAVRAGAKNTVEFAAKHKKGLAAGAAGTAGLTAAGLAAYNSLKDKD